MDGEVSSHKIIYDNRVSSNTSNLRIAELSEG